TVRKRYCDACAKCMAANSTTASSGSACMGKENTRNRWKTCSVCIANAMGSSAGANFPPPTSIEERPRGNWACSERLLLLALLALVLCRILMRRFLRACGRSVVAYQANGQTIDVAQRHQVRI